MFLPVPQQKSQPPHCGSCIYRLSLELQHDLQHAVGIRSYPTLGHVFAVAANVAFTATVALCRFYVILFSPSSPFSLFSISIFFPTLGPTSNAMTNHCVFL